MPFGKLGCIIRPETKADHAALTVKATQLKPAWSRITGTPRILGHNDQIGDCACVAAVMAVQTEYAKNGDFAPLSQDLAVQVYSAVTGYNPDNPATDQGTEPEQLFAWWQNNAIAGYKLGSYTRINPTNLNALRNAVLSGGFYLCVELATEQQNQTEWKPDGTPGTWGGHAVWADTYEANWFSATSWGESVIVDGAYLTGGFAASAYSLDLVSA